MMLRNTLLLLAAGVHLVVCTADQVPLRVPDAGAQKPTTQVEVHPPVFPPRDEDYVQSCVHTELLMEHVFANSYDDPFVADYAPPSCSFNHVIMNFTVFVKGRQFDRMGIMYLGDVEVFRTSTSEPSPTGVTWSYVKEMVMYNALWKQEQKLIFDLPNIVNEVYTGPLHTTLTATFFYQPRAEEEKHADFILPISASRARDGKGSAFTVPDDSASVSHVFTRDISRAIITLSACGQQEEEFWYTNVLDRDIDAFASTTGSLSGYSPFREVQLLIDGYLAGVSWPNPVIFTGGIAPGFWRPVVGIDAYDLQQQEIDITPWLSYLTDGRPHTFEIKVAGLDDSKDRSTALSSHVGGYWVVTGTIFLFQGNASPTDAVDPSLPIIDASPPLIFTSSATTLDPDGRNETLLTRTSVRRRITTTNTSNNNTFRQYLHFTNTNHLTNYGLIQSITQATTNIARISSPASDHARSYLLRPTLALNTSINLHPSDDGFSIHASLSRDQDAKMEGSWIFGQTAQNMQRYLDSSPPLAPLPATSSSRLTSTSSPEEGASASPKPMHAQTHTHQNGSAVFRAGKRNRYSFGALDTGIEFNARAGDLEERYQRFIAGANGTVRVDIEGIEVWGPWRRKASFSDDGDLDAGGEDRGDHMQEQAIVLGGRDSPRALLGRGPGIVRTGYLRSR